MRRSLIRSNIRFELKDSLRNTLNKIVRLEKISNRIAD